MRGQRQRDQRAVRTVRSVEPRCVDAGELAGALWSWCAVQDGMEIGCGKLAPARCYSAVLSIEMQVE